MSIKTYRLTTVFFVLQNKHGEVVKTCRLQAIISAVFMDFGLFVEVQYY